MKKPDDQFIDMKESIDKFQDNLEMVQNLYTRIVKRQLELEQNYLRFGKSIRGLSALELNVDQPLRQFAEATESFADALQERVIISVVLKHAFCSCYLTLEKTRGFTIFK